MKYLLMQFLICPACRAPRLELRTFTVERNTVPEEVRSGVLRCRTCSRLYPIVDGIPRMLPDSAEEHAQFLEGYGIERDDGHRVNRNQMRGFTKMQAAGRKPFIYASSHYAVTNPDENAAIFRDVTGLGADELAGRMVLDAGCGMGRFVEVAAACGANVVGLDLSRSVDHAFRNTQYRSRVNFIQGDLMNPPLRPASFDAVYSIGVLHHIPEPRRAFHSISQLVRAGKTASVWVYHRHQPEGSVAWHKRVMAAFAQTASAAVRVVTTRLPHGLLHFLCTVAAPLGWLKYVAGTNRVLKYLLAPVLLLPISAHRNRRVRICDTFEWLAPRFQSKHTTREVMGWFEEEGFEAVRHLNRSIAITGIRSSAEDSTAQLQREGAQHAYAG